MRQEEVRNGKQPHKQQGEESQTNERTSIHGYKVGSTAHALLT